MHQNVKYGSLNYKTWIKQAWHPKNKNREKDKNGTLQEFPGQKSLLVEKCFDISWKF